MNKLFILVFLTTSMAYEISASLEISPKNIEKTRFRSTLFLPDLQANIDLSNGIWKPMLVDHKEYNQWAKDTQNHNHNDAFVVGVFGNKTAPSGEVAVIFIRGDKLEGLKKVDLD